VARGSGLLTPSIVSDVFANGSESTTLWEFKHGNGSFKKGDLVGLREIKRRASRHALVNREYSNQKPPPSLPGTPAEPMPMPDGSDIRVNGMEHSMYDLNMRLHRNEETMQMMHMKYQTLLDTVLRVMQVNQDMSKMLAHIVPNHPESTMHREGTSFVPFSVSPSS